MDPVREQVKRAKLAASRFRSSTSEQRNAALNHIAATLRSHVKRICDENAKDIAEAHAAGYAPALVDRLLLDKARIEAMAKGVEAIANQEEVVGTVVSSTTRADGLQIERQRIPLGVIAMIFESRPNVVVDCSALAIKSGNSILLKGGKEAHHSNQILAAIVRESIAAYIPEDVVTLLDSKNRALVRQILDWKDDIDVVIPRGGEGLIQMVYENAKMPVIAHFKGLCHVFVDKDADQDKALRICVNAKAQRPGVCNAAETILVDAAVAETFLPRLARALGEQGIALRGCSNTLAVIEASAATPEDWSTEYLDKIVSIRVVSSLEEAIEHIDTYGSHHTEAICTENQATAQEFTNRVDASCVMVNASTRFNDGGELGLGAELGISTTKFHAYGPMGAAEMTTLRFRVTGDGHVRG